MRRGRITESLWPAEGCNNSNSLALCKQAVQAQQEQALAQEALQQEADVQQTVQEVLKQQVLEQQVLLQQAAQQVSVLQQAAQHAVQAQQAAQDLPPSSPGLHHQVVQRLAAMQAST